MRKMWGGQSLLTVLIMFSMIVAGSSIVATVVQGPSASQQGANAAEDDDPLAAARYLASLRQGPQGISPAKARQDALAQAQKLPAPKGLPVAKDGKGTKVEPGKELAAPFGQWHNLGPAPMDHGTLNPSKDYVGGIDSGRATSVVVGPNTGIIYLGTAGGGVWKSADGGVNWTALTDNQPSLAIGSLALDPFDTTDRTLYAGTGEANYDIYQSDGTDYQGDNYLGIGVLKTTDGGATWTLLGQNVFGSQYGTSSVGIGAIVANGTTVLAGTTNGLYKWDSSGTNFNQVTVASSNANARVTDITMDGANVYVVLSSATAGSGVAGVYKSTTGGGSGYSAIMSGLPAGTTWTRAQLAIARNSPQTLYLTIADKNWDLLSPNGIFKTTNGGGAWSPTGQPPNYLDVSNAQGFYDNVIAVDPANANLVYAGGVNIIASSNGGGSWTTIGNPYCNGGALPCTSNIHADNHAMAFGKIGTPRPLYVAGDGGLSTTTNGSGASVTWTSLNQHIATAQFYTGDASANFLTTGIVAGAAQDNGVSRSASGNGYGTWNGISGGDGTFIGISKQSANNGYTGLPNGVLRHIPNMDQTGSNLTVQTVSPPAACNDTKVSPLFVAPFALDPNDDQHFVYGGGGHVCETTNGGVVNYSVSVASLGAPIQTVAFAANASSTVYAGTATGKVWVTTNANQHPANVATWSACAAGGLPAQPVTGLATDPNDSTTIYATLAGFGNSHVYKVTDCTKASATWTALSGSGGTNPLPDAPVMSIVVYAGTNGSVLVVGGDVGVFVSEDNGSNWFNLHNQLPASVPIMKVFTDVAQTTLFAATHGRGMWEIPIPASSEAGISFSQSPVEFSNVNVGTSGNQTLTVTNNGTAPIVFGQIAFSNPPSITKGADTCSNKTMAPSSQCTIAFTFTPTLPGATTGQLTVNDNLAGTPQIVTVSGTGTGGGTATFNPASFGYGNRAVNTDNFQTFEIHNTGVGNLTVSGIGMTPNSGAYSVFANGCTGPVSPGDSCFINVNFRPTSSQSYFATLDFTDDAPSAGSQQHVQMSGFGISAIKFSPGDIDFGSNDINTSGTSPHPLTVTNVSGNTITFGPTDVVSSGDFVITDDTCNGNAISAGNSCLVDVKFHPLSVGSKNGRITVHVGSAETPFMSLEGFGINGAAPAVSVNPNPIAFSDTPFDPNTVGVYRNYLYVVLQNSGASPMQNISVSVDTNAADDHADFGIASSPCDGGGLVLQPGETCRMYVYFIRSL